MLVRDFLQEGAVEEIMTRKYNEPLRRHLRVYLVQDDVDWHDEGCDCGSCDSNNKSIGVGIYDATNADGTDTSFDAVLANGPYVRVYGCSEQAAMGVARALCAEKGWKVIA